MAQQNDPKLDIPVADAFNPKPTTFQLLFDTPIEYEKKGKYPGTGYAYKVKFQGEPHVIFATEGLHSRIQETGAVKDDWVAVLRMGTGKDTRWQVRLVDENGTPISTEDRPARPASTPSSSGSSRPSAPKLTPQERVDAFKMDEALYLGALSRATINVAPHVGGVTIGLDLNAVAFVLYRMAKDHGVLIDAQGEVDAPEPEPEPLPEEIAKGLDAVRALAAKLDGAPADGTIDADLLNVLRVLTKDEEKTWHTARVDELRTLYRYVDTSKDYADFLTNATGADELPF